MNIARRFVLIAAPALAFLGVKRARAALFPPAWMDAVAAIGFVAPDGSWQTVGTGFFFGHLLHDDPDEKKRQYQVFLVTARHVPMGFFTHSPGGVLQVRLNSNLAKTSAIMFNTGRIETGVDDWYYSEADQSDVAVHFVDPTFLRTKNAALVFFAEDIWCATTKKLQEMGTSAGDAIYVLGFPMGLAGVERNYVISRAGSIARISDLFDGTNSRFMIDSFVFPGNSGGPVILRPELMAIQGSKSPDRAYLIGMVVAYEPYRDTATSNQTGENRIIFEENSGLADVIPVDGVKKAVEEFYKRFSKGG